MSVLIRDLDGLQAAFEHAHTGDPRATALAVIGHIRKVGQTLTDDRDEHIIDLRPDGWAIQHPTECRLNGRDLFSCPVAKATVAAGDLQPAGGYQLGRFECWAADGELFIGRLAVGGAW